MEYENLLEKIMNTKSIVRNILRHSPDAKTFGNFLLANEKFRIYLKEKDVDFLWTKFTKIIDNPKERYLLVDGKKHGLYLKKHQEETGPFLFDDVVSEDEEQRFVSCFLYGGLIIEGVTSEDLGLCEEKGQYKNGKKDGLWLSYHMFGNLRLEKNYVDGKREGLYQYWKENGVKIVKGHYSEGKKHGKWKTFFSDGDLQSVGKYEDGERIGKWMFIHPRTQNLVVYDAPKSGIIASKDEKKFYLEVL